MLTLALFSQLLAEETIPAGSFLMKYTGEYLLQEEMEEREKSCRSGHCYMCGAAAATPPPPPPRPADPESNEMARTCSNVALQKRAKQGFASRQTYFDAI